jgi:signal transduction histidine kinase
MTLTARRLALTNSLIIFIAIGLFALFALPMRSVVTLRSIDNDLESMGESFAQTPWTAAPDVDVFLPRPLFVQSARLDGTVVIRSPNIGTVELPVASTSLARARSGNPQPFFESVPVNGHVLRSYERPVPGDGSPQATIGGIVEVSTPLDDRPRGPVLIGLIAGILLGGVGVLIVGWVLARIAMAPVDRLAATVDSIGSTDDLSRRLPTNAFGSVRLDSVVRLTYAFNAMLDRLQTSTEQVERSLELQRQFVGDASHQLRTPLTSLRGNVHLLSQLCAEDCPAASIDEHQAILSDLDAETERMTRLVNGLLVLARADAQQHLLLSPVELGPLIKDAWRTAQSLTDNVTVELGAVPSGVQVRADADRLVQLLVILLENAVLYSPQGGQVQMEAVVESRHARPGVRVDVMDAGPGVPAEERSRIFERFYRSRRTEAAADGVGLGLAVAEWIAREHEAEITVADNEPAGSVFQLWLPGERVQYAQNA